ncbi:SHOCT domain-containing protein [Phenylobacterium sp.]|uniref:SHOCT domain-containing protein n=1 Tax=Phenylobacterium sp. TaxID=1871053 RepID=UPI0035B48D77
MKGVFNILAYICVLVGLVIATMGLGLIVALPLMLLTFAGSAGRAAKAEQIVATTLMPGEAQIAVGIQLRAFALFRRRAVAAITNSRVIIVRRGLLGGFKMGDIQWKDLKDVTIEENVLASLCGSNLNFAHLTYTNQLMAVDGLPSDIAAKMYSHAQSEEQQWEEKRRVRAMEEHRAAAGGVVVHTQPQQAERPAPAARSRLLSEIQEAKKLLDDGVISDAEFQEMKSKILAAG